MIKFEGVYGDDLMVVNFARESTGKRKERIDEKDIKFINYLAREQHIAPFFHPKLSFRVIAPFFIARQWERHRMGVSRLDDFSDTSEMSRRYVTHDPEYHEFEEWHEKPLESIKQGSGGSIKERSNIDAVYINAQLQATENYHSLLNLNVAPEQSRGVFLMSTNTQWIETGSLHYWARFCDLREDSHAQKDIQKYANIISKECNKYFPHSWHSLLKHAPTAMKNEIKKLNVRIKELEEALNESKTY